MIVLKIDELFPDKSVEEYIIKYVPTTFPFTEPITLTDVVPSTKSNASAPSSVYKPPTIKDIVDEPFIVIIEAVVSFITTNDVEEAEFPEESVAVHTTVDVPKVKSLGA